MPLPIATCTAGLALNKASQALATSAPTGTSAAGAKAEAHGRVGMDGKISFALDAAKTVTPYVYSEIASKWLLLPTVAALANQHRWVDAPPKCLFFLAIDATTANAWVYSDQIG